MPAVSTFSPTTDPLLNGVLSGIKWATGSLTFSFPASGSLYGSYGGSNEPTTGFEAFNATQIAATRAVLQMYSAVANVTFTEVTETSSVHGDLRYAESDAPSTAWAYYPSTSALGGDIWLNNSKNYYDNPLVGTYAFQTLLHETGHAMGLKHPQDAKSGFAAMPANYDSLEYTVMSYRSYVGAPLTGYTAGSSSYPQTLMMYDIAALQFMYGANYTTNADNSTYTWSASTGRMSINGVGQGTPAGNKIFMTIWDGGGIDTYDFSNYTTGVTVNLQPGSWTTASSTQLASLGSGHYAAGNIANALLYDNNTASLIENAVGGSAIDNLTGNVADNSLKGGAGNDVLDGAAGSDIAVYSGMFANYSIAQNADGSWQVVDLRTGSPDGSDKLWNIELLQFSDVLETVGGETQQPPPEQPPSEPSNSAPVIASATAAGVATEWADKSSKETSNTLHTATGSVTYTDANTLDTHTASFAARGAGYLGTFSLNTTAIDSADKVTWSFSVSDSAIDYLNAGQTLTQLYDVTIDDGHGGTVVQTITITIKGAADGATRAPRKTRGSSSDTDDGQDLHGLVLGHGRQADGQGMDEDQIPAPHPASGDLMTFLGAHLHFSDHLI